MKKVLSFCVLSVLLAVLSVGLKAQSGLVLTPPNLPDPIVLNQYDTIILSPNSSCFDALGLAPDDEISIEWQVLYDGNIVPSDSLSFYFAEFKFESRYDLGENTNQWWGRSYTSDYCQNGNGYGSYPGANTPIVGQGNCTDPGHFIISPLDQNNTSQLDYFYVRFFTDAAVTGHRLVYNIKVDGDYQFIFSLGKRCNGSKWDRETVGGDERYYIGGHQSALCGILTSDTIHGFEVSDITDYYRCAGDSLVLGNPAVTYRVSTDTNIAPGYDSVFYMSTSSCGAGIDSIVRFRVFFEDPALPKLDTAGSILALCDSGEISIKVSLIAADQCIWFDAAHNVIDTLDGTATFTTHITQDTLFYAVGYNSASGCTGTDTLTVYAKVFASPNPQVTANPETLCENAALKVSLDQRYDKWDWFHNGDSMNLDTLVYDVADADTTDGGKYWATVSMNHVHPNYPTADTVVCSATDTVTVTVYPRPTAHWVSIDSTVVTDSATFCPSDLRHVLVAAVTDGQTPYGSFRRIQNSSLSTYNFSYSSLFDTVTITVEFPLACDASYRFGINTLKDAHGCTLKDTLDVTLFVKDTIDPIVTRTQDTVIAALAYENCEYVTPNVMSKITTSDNCALRDTVQEPAAGTRITADTIIVVTVTDLCNRTASDTIELKLPVKTLAIDTVEVTEEVLCAGADNGAIRITLTGGAAPYDVRIHSLKATDSIRTAHGTDTVFEFDRLIEGKWTIDVTDTNGCTVAQDTIDVAAPAMLTLTSDSLVDLTCFESNDGSFKFRVQQGTAPYEVKIIRTLGSSVDSVEMTLNPAALDTTIKMTNQKAGIYVINVEDAHGCTASDIDTINQPDQLVLEGDTVLAHVLCYGDTTGQIAVTGVTGGTTPYSFVWLNENRDTVSTDSVTSANLAAGAYTIIVTDANGCQADTTLTDTIQQPEGPLTLTSDSLVNLTCFESNDGSFKFNVKDGTTPYTVKIHREYGNDSEDTTLTLNPTAADTTIKMTDLKVGYYTITVQDDNGCVADTICDTLTQPDALTLLGVDTLNDVKCFGDANGQLAVTGVTGGTPDYVFEWRYAANDSVVSHDSVTGRILTAGDYKIYITDANNCAPNDTITATITGPDTALTVTSLVAPINDTCPHLGKYVFSAEVKGGRLGYNFVWTLNGDTTLDHDVAALTDTFNYMETVISCDTTFDVVFTVTDDSACVASESLTFTIQDTTKPVITVNTLSGMLDTVTIDACEITAASDTLNTIEKLINFNQGIIQVSDNCTPTDSLIVNFTQEVPDTCPFKVVRTYTVTDKCGLTSNELKQVFIVQDTTKPVFTRHPASDTVYCNGDESRIEDAYNHFVDNKAGAEATDNCTLDSVSMVLDSVVQGCNRVQKTYYYKFTAYDHCMNYTTEYANFYVFDTLKPYFTLRANDTIKYECEVVDTNAARLDALSQFRWADRCDTAFLKASYLGDFDPGCGGPTGSYTHYVVISDGCNEDTATHIIAIVDTKKPYILQPWTNPEVACDGAGNHQQLFAFLYDSIRVSDECSGIQSVTVYLGTNANTPFDTSASALLADRIHYQGWEWDDPNDTLCSGHYTFTWVVRDSCGNTNTTTENFYIKDQEAPDFTVTRQNMTVDCSFSQDEFNDWLALPKSYDACARDSFPVTHTKAFDRECGVQGVWRVTWRTQDLCGNVKETSARLTVIDTTAPQIHTVNAGGLLNNDTLWTGDTLYYSSIPNWPAPDIHKWTKTGMDSLESAEFIRQFMRGDTVYGYSNGQDNVPHVFNTGIDGIDECGWVKDFYYENSREITTGPDASDSCTKRMLVEYTFKDACNNKFTINQLIVVLDTTPPQITSVYEQKYFLGPDQGCVKEDVPIFSTIRDIRVYEINTFNSSTSGFEPLDLHLPADTAIGFVTLDSVKNTVPTANGYACDSIEIRYYTISDYCGNSTSFTHTLNFTDTITPKFSINGQPMTSTAVVTDTIHQTTDCNTYYEIIDGLDDSLRNEAFLLTHYGLEILDCHSHDILRNYVSLPDEYDANLCPGKVIVRKYTVSKDCGGSSSFDSYFTVRLVVKDTTGPVVDPQLSAPVLRDTTIALDEDCQRTLPTVVEFSTYKQMKEWNGGQDIYTDCNLTDNCEVVWYGPVKGGIGCDSTYTYKYTVADSCGNMSSDTVTLTIHIVDTIAPKILAATATLFDTVYFASADCAFPDLTNTYWTTPAQAIDHHVDMTDCNAKWSDDQNIKRYDANDTADLSCATFITVKYAVKDSCICTPERWSDTIYQKIVVLDTFAPTFAPNVTALHDTTIYSDAACNFDLNSLSVNFTDYAQLRDWAGMEVYTDCNLGETGNVRACDTISDGTVCDSLVIYKYIVKDECGNWSKDSISLTIHIRDTVAPTIVTATADLVDSVYYTTNCDIPDLTNTYWTTPQQALDHSVVFDDCHKAWDNPAKLVILADASDTIRENCTTKITVPYQVKDSCDNLSDTIYQRIWVLDTVRPVVTVGPKDTLTYLVDVTPTCWGTDVPYFTTVADVKAYDPNFSVNDCNVGDNSLVVLDHADSLGFVRCERTVVRYYYVEDSCDLKSDLFTHTITVRDTTAPAITGNLEPKSVAMTEDCQYDYANYIYTKVSALPNTITIEDCTLVDTLYSTVDTVATAYLDACDKAFSLYVTYTVMDSCGKAAMFYDTIYVADAIAPKVTGTLDTATLYLSATCGYSIPDPYQTVAALNANANFEITDCKLVDTVAVVRVDTISGYCPMLIRRVYFASDSCDHRTEFYQHYFVQDTVRPAVNGTLPNDTIYIDRDSNFTAAAPFEYASELNAVVTDIVTDCNLVDPINSYKADTIYNNAECYGSFIRRKYTVTDSCGKVSDTIVHMIIMTDTVRPHLDVDALPDQDAVASNTNCKFYVPNFHDTIQNHYIDNWSDLTYYSQDPAANDEILHFRDTVVTITYGDVCGNRNTITVRVNVPDSLEVTVDSVKTPNCWGENTGKIYVSVDGGTPNYVYTYSGGGALTTAATDTLFEGVAEGTYDVTVTDENSCVATTSIVVSQPTAVSMTKIVNNPENCLNTDTTSVGITMTGGTGKYHMVATLLDVNYSELGIVFDTNNVVSASDIANIDPIRDTLFVAFFGEDSLGCSKHDTSEMIIVHPIYQYEQEARVCFTIVHEQGYDWYDEFNVFRDHIPASVFTHTDSIYTLTDAQTTVHNCDSIYVMHLRVENTPYLRARSFRDIQPLVHPTNAIEQAIYDTFNIASTNVGWEIFVDKNCMTCATPQEYGLTGIKDPVSIEYDLYRYNEVTQNYELMPNVGDYFEPYYRTFMDNYRLEYTAKDDNHVSIPGIYEPHGNGADWSFDFFNLCWLAPDYDDATVNGIVGHESTGSGEFYADARANNIKIANFHQEGDYLIVATLYERTGTSMNPAMNYSWNLALNVPMGGNTSELGRAYGIPIEIYFHVDNSSAPEIHMPASEPIGGSVVFSSNREVEAAAHVYPNPARDFVQVELSGFEGKTNVVLSSSAGKVLQTINLDIADRNDTPIVKIETGDYAQGVYMVTARNKETIITKRVIIIR